MKNVALKLPGYIYFCFHEWFFNVFSDFYGTDLYDAFIESNKKEDPAERMWSIRSVVSVLHACKCATTTGVKICIIWGQQGECFLGFSF